MGTTVSITVADQDTDSVAAAVDAAREEVRRIGREWYPWSSEGELVRLNAALAAGRTFEATPELADILNRSQQYTRSTGGAFDPAIGGLVRLWGFNSAEHSGVTPTKKQLDAWRKDHARLVDLVVDGRSARATRRDLVIDLGAIGKGYAVDRAIDVLRKHGIEHALVNAGGNLRAIGRGRSGPWRVAIRNPRAVAALAWLEVGDESVATSGDYERFAFVNGRRVHHLLDPRTGEVANHTQAVTVVAPDATLADAASTAIFIAGPDGWRAAAKALGVREVLRVAGDGRIQITEPLRARLHAKSATDRTPPWEVVDIIDL